MALNCFRFELAEETAYWLICSESERTMKSSNKSIMGGRDSVSLKNANPQSWGTFLLSLVSSASATTWSLLKTACTARMLPLLLPLALAAALQAQDYSYITNNGTITITGYACPSSNAAVTIPSTINGLPVTALGDGAFMECDSLTSVTIPSGVITLGDSAFMHCSGLTNVTISSSVTSIGDGAFYRCFSLTEVNIGASVTYIGNYAFAECGLTSVTIPNSVTGTGYGLFLMCMSLTNVTVGNHITNIANGMFSVCSSLGTVYFKSDAPTLGLEVFLANTIATVFYLPGATGWSPTFGGRPTMLWNPQIQASQASLGVGASGFSFTIIGTTDIPVMVEASVGLESRAWLSLKSCTITNGSVYFTDSDWSNHPTRFYRVRSP